MANYEIQFYFFGQNSIISITERKRLMNKVCDIDLLELQQFCVFVCHWLFLHLACCAVYFSLLLGIPSCNPVVFECANDMNCG